MASTTNIVSGVVSGISMMVIVVSQKPKVVTDYQTESIGEAFGGRGGVRRAQPVASSSTIEPFIGVAAAFNGRVVTR